MRQRGREAPGQCARQGNLVGAVQQNFCWSGGRCRRLDMHRACAFPCTSMCHSSPAHSNTPGACMRALTQVLHSCIHTHAHTRAHARTQTHTPSFTRTCIHNYTHAHRHTHIHMPTHSNYTQPITHTHTQTRAQSHKKARTASARRPACSWTA